MIRNYVFIIGSMKSGTTSLFSYLEQHPQIAASTDKEPCFFSRKDILSKGYDWYQSLWKWDVSKHVVAMEGSTSYTRIPTYLNAAEEIKNFQTQTNSNIKFIYIVRHPIERIESHYTYAKSLKLRESKEQTDQPLHSDFLVPSMYARQISEYYDRFSEDDILIVDFDKFKHNTADTLKEICTFLNLDAEFEFQNINKAVNANKGRVENDAVWLRLRKVSFLYSVAQMIPQSYKDTLHGLYGRKVEGNIPLTREMQQFATDELKEDVESFSSKFKFDTSAWNM